MIALPDLAEQKLDQSASPDFSEKQLDALAAKISVHLAKLIGPALQSSAAPPATEPDGPLLTRFELAEKLHVSVTTIDRMAGDGRLRKIRVGKRGVRFDLADAQAALAAEGDSR